MIHIMRHGQTETNRMGLIQGYVNVPLNETGKIQAISARERLYPIHFDVCYASPLDRAQLTAKLALEGRDIPILTEDRLHEWDFGHNDGLPWNPETKLLILTDNNESIEVVRERIESFMRETIIPLHDQGKSVLVVAHAGILLSMVNHCHGVPLEQFWANMPHNCEAYRLSDDEIEFIRNTGK